MLCLTLFNQSGSRKKTCRKNHSKICKKTCRITYTTHIEICYISCNKQNSKTHKQQGQQQHVWQLSWNSLIWDIPASKHPESKSKAFLLSRFEMKNTVCLLCVTELGGPQLKRFPYIQKKTVDILTHGSISFRDHWTKSNRPNLPIRSYNLTGWRVCET